ncbi:scavenger receptor class B member 1-like protein, partial [Dinothrombium tinctorium]
MFRGYDDNFISLASIANPQLAKNKGKFGYYWPKNGTDDGLFTVHTGSDINLLSMIDRFNGQESLKLWSSDECNRLNESTSGQIQPQPLENKHSIKIFQPAFCRSLSFEFLRTEKTKDGFNARKYLLSKKTFLNAIDYPPNFCYGSKLPRKSSKAQFSFLELFSPVRRRKATLSFPSGVMDMSKCLFGAPVIFSLPHFLHAHHSYLHVLSGLSPNETAHSFWIDIEPLTGITVDMAFRTQINIHINVPDGLSQYKNAPEIVFPIFWQEIGIHWPQHLKKSFTLLLYTPIIASIAFVTIALVLLTSFCVLAYRYQHKLSNFTRQISFDFITAFTWKNLRKKFSKNEFSPNEELNGNTIVIGSFKQYEVTCI